MKKFLLVAVLSLAILMIGCGKKEDKKTKIGITQIIEHPALDASKDGFLQALKDAGYDETKVDIEFQSAQGDFGTAQTIANSYVQGKKDLILAIATPSAQAAYNMTKDIPILITAVTDPESAGLTGDNISGTSDMSPVKQQMELIKKLLPNAKKVGIVYNTSEQNSEFLIKRATEECEKLSLEVITSGVTNVNEVASALDVILGKVDVLYVPTDNLMTAATPLVLQKTNEAKIPVIGSIKDMVEQGAVATETIDYYKLGYQTGEMAVEILKGASIKDMPVETLKDTQLIINKRAAEEMGISLDNIDGLDKAEIF
ncbi:ABC transporter substrate-binding protein [uncultured Ilyobacter sp.]|uniref:ABC transporter substrate-binding protein n=1 Tax=uncultured Ilyobacter sp. TaxID=544433 RepID=UPI0029C9535B|nr:ABC transporter substrate-binding protein [uncultured Ilyobacter sp.]